MKVYIFGHQYISHKKRFFKPKEAIYSSSDMETTISMYKHLIETRNHTMLYLVVDFETSKVLREKEIGKLPFFVIGEWEFKNDNDACMRTDLCVLEQQGIVKGFNNNYYALVDFMKSLHCNDEIFAFI